MRSLAVTALIAIAAVALPLMAQGRGCSETKKPEQLPPPSAIIDSAHAITDLATLPGSSRTMLFSLVYNEDDSLPHVRPLEETETGAVSILMVSLRPQQPSELWAIRVRVVGGASPALTLERSKYCPPVPGPVDPNIPVITHLQTQRGERLPMSGRLTVRVEALISVEGRARVVRVTQSSGIKDIDDQIVQDYERRRFKPAQLDGQPIEAVYRTDGQSPRL